MSAHRERGGTFPPRHGIFQFLFAAALAAALAGCVVPTGYATDLFADVCEGRLVIVLNVLDLAGGRGERMVVYQSGRGLLSRWALVGTYSGKARACAVHNGRLYVFFDGPLARTYPLPGDDAPRAPRMGGAPGREPGRIVRLPFEWTPRAACRDGAGALWAVGVHEGRIAVARLGRGDGDGARSWETAFPKGPAPKELGGKPEGPGPPDGPGRADAPVARVRACAAEDLLVFWSVAPAGAKCSERIGGARLGLGGPGATGAEWKMLPALELPAEDFCAAPGSGGEPGLVLFAPRAGWPVRARLEPSGSRWGDPEVVSAAGGRFLFGYLPGAAWVKWDDGELLLRSNTQRVEILSHRDGRWREFRPAGGMRSRLAELEALVLAGGALLLVLAGGTTFAVRLLRFRPSAGARRPERASGGSLLAPISHRTLAAILDIVLVGGLVVSLAGFPEAAGSPLVPDIRPLVVHGVALAALAAYGAILEAAFGATLGKLALGIRVERTGGGRPHLRQAILRNVLRPVDLLPPYLGAIGLAVMAVTRLRQRLGDLVAGTVVVALGPAPKRREAEAP